MSLSNKKEKTVELGTVSESQTVEKTSVTTEEAVESVSFEGSTHSFLCEQGSSVSDKIIASAVIILQTTVSILLMSWSAKQIQKETLEAEDYDLRRQCTPNCTTFSRDWLGDQSITMDLPDLNACGPSGGVVELSVRDNMKTSSGTEYYTTEYVYWSQGDNITGIALGLIILSAFFLEPMQSNFEVFKNSKVMRVKVVGFLAFIIDVLLFVSGVMMLRSALGEADFMTLIGGPVGLLFMDDLDEKVFEAIGDRGSARTLFKIGLLSFASLIVLVIVAATPESAESFFNVCKFDGEW
jgi:hypothetical protein